MQGNTPEDAKSKAGTEESNTDDKMAKKVKLTKAMQSIIIKNEDNEKDEELDGWQSSESVNKEDGKSQRQSSQSAKKENREEGWIEK